ncbi:MAG: condensation domain protein [Chthoniobacterales bacterium]|nr:condensation domain protein [Chthoniobacterales bacterium]
MQKDLKSKLQDLVASGQVRLVPMTFPQRELWETSPVAPGDPSNHIRSFIDLTGPLTFDMCREALCMVVARQEVMRTSFLPGKDRPLQMIRAQAEPAIEYREIDDPSAGDEEIIASMEEGFRRPFDLLRGPLYRLQMVRRGPDHNALGLTIHHAIADGWSVTSFVEDLYTACISLWRASGKDMSRLSGMRDSLPPLPVTYSAWGAGERARWQPGEISGHADYWRSRLGGSRPLFDVAGAVSDQLEKWDTSLPADLAEPARATARREGVTLFSTLLAAFRLALHRWKGANDVVVGAPVAGRAKTSLRETMGYFSANVPLRSIIDSGAPFNRTLKNLHNQVVEDFARAMPFVELAAAVENDAPRARHSVYDVRFGVHNHPFPGIEIPGMSSSLRSLSSGTSRFDIGCDLTEDGKRIILTWLRRPSAATRSDMEELDRLFRAVLSEVCR